jgi:hypothetical protein
MGDEFNRPSRQVVAYSEALLVSSLIGRRIDLFWSSRTHMTKLISFTFSCLAQSVGQFFVNFSSVANGEEPDDARFAIQLVKKNAHGDSWVGPRYVPALSGFFSEGMVFSGVSAPLSLLKSFPQPSHSV